MSGTQAKGAPGGNAVQQPEGVKAHLLWLWDYWRPHKWFLLLLAVLTLIASWRASTRPRGPA
jgi:hypothetical protein